MNLARAISDYDDPRSLGSRLRAARARPLIEMIAAISARQGRCSIIDLGGCASYWNIIDADFLRRQNCEITLCNLLEEDTQGFRLHLADACATGLPDDSFDIVHSNSTVEHVGNWRRMKLFASEVRRLAPRCFVQTPNFWFPVEPHFGFVGWQFLPHTLRYRLLLWRGWGNCEKAADFDAAMELVDTHVLLDRRMLAELFPEARIVTERLLGLAKSFVAIV